MYVCGYTHRCICVYLYTHTIVHILRLSDRFPSLPFESISKVLAYAHRHGWIQIKILNRMVWQSHRLGKDDRMISPQIILNHPVDFITKDDLPGNEAKLRKSLPNGGRQGPKGGGASRRPLRGVVVLHSVRISLVLLHSL